MIIGHNHHRLERRLTNALLSGIANPGEAVFLQKISMDIFRHGSNAHISQRQAAWLFAILTRCEKKPSPTRKRSPQPPRLPTPQQRPEESEPFHIEECFIDPQTPPKHSLAQPNLPPAPVSSMPREPAPKPPAAQNADIGDMIRRIITRNENFRKRQERVDRQRLQSSSTSLTQCRSPDALIK